MDQTVDNDTFKRKHNELAFKIQNLENDVATIENQRGFDIDIINEILGLTQNLYQTYQRANFEAKKHYLSIFFEKLEVKDKEIERVTYAPLFNRLLTAEKACRVSSNWLARWDDFRTFEWVNLVKNPEEVIVKTQQVLTSNRCH